MIYLVKCVCKDFSKKNPAILYPGYSSNETMARKYLKIKEEKASDKTKYEIIPIPDEKFEELKRKDPAIYLSSEIGEVAKNIFITDDDYEFINQVVAEEVSNLQYHFRESVKILKLFENEDAKKLVKMMKKMSKIIDTDYEGEVFYDTLDWDRVIKRIDL